MTTQTQDRRRLRSATTRRTLLRTASTLFATHGFEGTSLDLLASRSGINKALVGYHFGGKRGLYEEVAREAIREGLAELEPVRLSSDPPDRRLAAFVDAFDRMTRRHPEFVPLILREEMSGGRNLDREVWKEFLGFYELDREILEDGMRQGVFREVDPHEFHLSLVGSLAFFLLTEPLRQQRRDLEVSRPGRESYFQHVKSTFLQGLQPGPRS